MPTEDGFNPDHPLPLFLTDRPVRQGIQKDCDRAVISSRGFKAGILIAAATATGIVVASVGDPVTLFGAVTASLVGNSELQSSNDQPGPTIQSAADAPAPVQSTADAQALPPTAKDAPLRDEIAASEPAGKDQAEKSEPSSEDLFRQYQAWVAEKDVQANVRPVEPVQDPPARVPQNARAQVAENAAIPHRLTQKHRHVLPIHNSRAETRTQNFRKNVRQAQRARVERPPTHTARVERPPIQDARAESQPMQDSQAPSFLPIFGLRN